MKKIDQNENKIDLQECRNPIVNYKTLLIGNYEKLFGEKSQNGIDNYISLFIRKSIILFVSIQFLIIK